MEKKGLVLTSLLFLVNFVSAYGEHSGLLLGNYYLDINLILSVGIFMTIFVSLSIATRKIHLFHTEGARIFVSFILAMFSVYGLSKLNISYEELFINLGIQNFLMTYGIWLLILFFIIIVWIYNLRTFILIAAGAFIVMGFTGMADETIVFNWDYSLMIGISLLLFYLWLKKGKKVGRFKPGKTTTTAGMARLDIITPAGEVKYANQKAPISLALPYRGNVKIYIRNGGDKQMQWKANIPRGLRISKSRGILGGGMHSLMIVKKTSETADIKEIVIYARGAGDKRRETQMAKIHIYPTDQSPKDTNTSENDNPTEEGKKIEKKIRTAKELQKKYDYYSKLVRKIMKANNGLIPGFDKGHPETGDGWRRHRYIQAMITIEKMAKAQGIQLRYEKWYEPMIKNAQRNAARMAEQAKKQSNKAAKYMKAQSSKLANKIKRQIHDTSKK